MKNRNSILILFFISLAIAITGCKMDITEQRPQEEILLEEAVKDISVPTEISADTNTIILPKELKEEKYKNLSIEWTSSNPQVIDITNGKVIHGDKDESDEVLLTVKLSINSHNITKEYTVLVKNKCKPNSLLLSDALKTISIPKVISVDTKTILLPSTFDDPKFSNITIRWQSDKTNIIDLQGNVKHEDKTESDLVSLTAIVTSNNESKMSKYEVEVKNVLSEEKKLLNEALQTVSIPLEINEDEIFINLLTKFSEEKYQNINITWMTSNGDVISNKGIIKHSDKNENDTVTLTILLNIDNKNVSKDFIITVKNRKFSNDQKELNTLVDKFSLPYEKIEKTITSIELPLSIQDTEVTIVWESDNEEIINSKTKEVKHPDSVKDSNVTLKAIFTYHRAKATKEFNIQVLSSPSNNTIIEEARKEIVNRTSAEIKPDRGAIVLIEKIEDPHIPEFKNLAVSWQSMNTQIIFWDSETRYWAVQHTPKADPQQVTLKFTISYNGDSKTFELITTVFNPTKTPEEIQDENDTNKINGLLTDVIKIPSIIKEHETEINLPASIDYKESTVNISWTISNEEIISKEGKVTHTPGRQADIITLTGTFTLHRISKNKTYSITVKHPETSVDATEIINIAKEYLPIIKFNDLSLLEENHSLPLIQVVDNKKVSITWELITSDKHFSLTNNNLLLTRDLGEIKGTIRAHLSYGNNTGIKDFEITIPQITEINYQQSDIKKFILLENNILELVTSDKKSRYQMSNLNLNEHRMSLQLIQFFKNNKWVNIETMKQEKITLYDALLTNSKNVEKAQLITTEILKPFIETFYAIWVPSEQIINEDLIYNAVIDYECFGPDVTTVDAAKALSADKKHDAFKKFYNNLLGEINEVAKVDKSTKLDETISILKQDYQNKEPIINCSYTLPYKHNDPLNVLTIINTEEPWYAQYGEYINSTLHVFLKPKDLYFRINNDKYAIKIAPDGKSFTGTGIEGNSSSISVTIANFDYNTLKIKVDQTELTLNFTSKSILQYNTWK